MRAKRDALALAELEHFIRRVTADEIALRGDTPPGWNYRKGVWLRYGRRGRELAREVVWGHVRAATLHMFRRMELDEKEAFVVRVVDALERLGALDVFTPAIDEERRRELDSKARGRGRPRKDDAGELDVVAELVPQLPPRQATVVDRERLERDRQRHNARQEQDERERWLEYLQRRLGELDGKK